MASNDNTREVALNLKVKTQGGESVSELGSDLKDLGKSGKTAAGEIDPLAVELQQLTTEAEAAAVATKRLADAEAHARGEQLAARKALDAKRDALALLKAETDAAGRKEADYQAKVRQLTTEIIAARAASRDKADAMRAAAAASQAAVAAEGELASKIASVISQQREAALAAAASGKAQAQTSATVRDGLQGIASQLRTIQTIAGAAIGGQLLGGMVGDVARTADAYTNLRARMSLVVGEGAALDQALEGVVDVATRTGSALEDTGTLFTRLAQAGKDAGLSSQQAAQQALALTESIGQAVQISGASAEASQTAITQLIQGLQSGVLRGEEFNAQMENAPRLARALADGLGVTTGELRKLAEAGQLTSQTVIAALQGQSTTLAAEFNRLPPTVGRALQNLSTQWTQYVGEADKATGASAAAASIINGLANNLDTLGSLLYAAGKAAAAYQVLNLARTFFDVATGARASAAAVVANTEAMVASKVAAVGVADGMTAAAASAGRFAAIASTLKTFSLIGVLTNAKEIGTWLGEAAARLVGYRDRTADLEKADKAASLAAREHAQSVAALAQQHQLAENKALGLTTQARALVAEFEKSRTGGDSAAEAVGKLAKSLDLGNLQGIKDAGAALDALGLKGAASAQQVRDALAKALNGADLQVFETNARAAFDGSEQGARRLAAAIDAVTIEALRRAGTSVQELQTGFSTAANSAINDVDALAASVDRLGAKGPEVGRALSGSLDKALDAANTERAIQAVIDRWQALGTQGTVTGEQLAAGLEKARAKLDELRPGISSLDEALKTFGLKTRAELQQTADTYGKAWAQISTSTTTSLADKAKAFAQFRDAAAAANNGVVPSEVALQGEILKTQLMGTEAGQKIAEGMGLAGTHVDALAGRVAALNAGLSQTAGNIAGSKIADSPDKNPNPFSGAQPDYTVQNDLNAKFAAGTLTAADRTTAEANLAAARANQQAFGKVPGAKGFDQALEKAIAIVDRINNLGTAATGNSTTHTVNIKVGSTTAAVKTATAADATTLTDILRQLETAAARSA